jgi:prepilin-type N-terminal cleavage/methylation domain-containing protein
MGLKTKIKESKGYTLIEVLVAAVIFSILVAGPTGLFISSLRGQTRTLLLGRMTESSSYSSEYMSRALRMAKKDLTGSCITAKTNYQNPSGISSIRFLRYDEALATDTCMEFLVQAGRLGERKSPNNTSSSLGAFSALTPNELEVTSTKFVITGQNQSPIDDLQPKVTIYFRMIKKNQSQPEMKVETTVSQRNLDIPY